MMKKVLSILLIGIIATVSIFGLIMGIRFLFTMSALSVLDNRMEKQEIFTYVLENKEQIKAVVTDFIENTPDPEQAKDNELIVPYWDGVNGAVVGKNSIDIPCGGYGMGSATGYTGVHYLFSGQSVVMDKAMNGADFSALGYKDMRFVRKGKGWIWREPDGDNRIYIEQITDNFYYYLEEF